MTNERFLELLDLVDAVNQSDKHYTAIERYKNENKIFIARQTERHSPLYDMRYFYDAGLARLSDYSFTFGDIDLKQGEAALRKMLEEVRDGV